jgi:hypothetical protein
MVVDEIPQFFIPAATPEIEESVYADFARMCHRSVLERGRRIYSITFVHDGEEWTATVGEALSGKTLANPRSRSKTPFYPRSLSDPAIVLAIFPGVPYVVLTNHRMVGNVGSAWENPFFAGQPKRITLFSV